MSSAKGSMTRAKSKGERGQPCLVPLPMQNGVEVRPFAITVALGSVVDTVANKIIP